MLHRVILGSLHRFIGIIIEHYVRYLPFWLAPVQALICTITNDADSYADKVYETLFAAGLRVQMDMRPVRHLCKAFVRRRSSRI